MFSLCLLAATVSGFAVSGGKGCTLGFINNWKLYIDDVVLYSSISVCIAFYCEGNTIDLNFFHTSNKNSHIVNTESY